MRSHSSSTNLYRLFRLGVFNSPKTPFLSVLAVASRSPLSFKLSGPSGRIHGLRHRVVQVSAMDEDISSHADWGNSEGFIEQMLPPIEGGDCNAGIVLNLVTDVDLPAGIEQDLTENDALNADAHRVAMLKRGPKKKRTKYGVVNNIGLMTFLIVLVLVVDLYAWRIVRLPLGPFYLMRPFCTSAFLVSCAGYICVPILYGLNIRAIIRKGPAKQSSKEGTPSMGGLFFVPIGVFVAVVIVGFSSIEVSAAAATTLAFAVIGLLDDFLNLIKNQKKGLFAWTRILLEVAVGIWFSFWLDNTNISSPYSMKMLVPLPAPLGLVCLGKSYLFLTSFCFVSMANGIDLTDGLDGLAGGTAALALIGMSIAVLPVCADLAVFGASMAGACLGFLLHNRFRASVFMGDTGSLALGGALASMAAITGMFLPLFISSGIFVVETLSVIMQISFFKTTKWLQGAGRGWFRMAPFHHHLELCGLKEPTIVAGAYVTSGVLALFAGYVGLVSA